MKTENFIKLIQVITGRNFDVNTNDVDLKLDSEYVVFRVLPATKRHICFTFKTPKNEENLIRSFINQYCKKYKEPNPAKYTGQYCGQYSAASDWNAFSDKQKEYAYLHHSSYMFSDKQILSQIKENINNSTFEKTYCKYGFYETIYGIGIFVLFSGIYEVKAIKRMETFLKNKNIPFSNEFSNARWVYRFVINISKDIHLGLLNEFSKSVN